MVHAVITFTCSDHFMKSLAIVRTMCMRTIVHAGSVHAQLLQYIYICVHRDCTLVITTRLTTASNLL